MTQLPNSFPVSRLASALAMGFLLSACGGGASAPSLTTPTSGFAIDGYLSGATVLCDSNGNSMQDAGEMTVRTDSAGGFSFLTGCNAGMVAMGGTNIDTSLPFEGMLKAPAGAKVITPLTTLMAEGLTQTQLITLLGLPSDTDLLNTDPAYAPTGTLINGQLMRATAAMQVSMQKTTEAFIALSGSTTDADKQAIYSTVAAAVADVLKAGGVLGTASAVDQTALASLVKAAALRVGQASNVSAQVRTALNAVNADSLATVIAPGLKSQADAILNAGTLASGLSAVMLTQQTDSRIATFLASNKTSAGLTSAPSAATTTLAADLNALFTNTGGGGGTSTALVSFDAAGVTYTLTGFGGAEASTVVTDPAGGSNKVAEVIKSASAELWAGTTISTGANQSIATVPFTADAKTMTLRVWAPAAGIPIRLKLEDAADNTHTVETEATTTVANTWETLTFNFANQATGTAALNLAYTFNKASVFPNFGKTGGDGGGGTFYFDDLAFGGDGGGGGGGGGGTEPTTAAPIPPARSASDVLSVYGDAYTPIGNVDLNPNWGQTTAVSQISLGGNNATKLAALNYQGIDWSASPIDVSTMSHLHIDVWTPDVTSFKVSIISQGAENAVTLTPTMAGWNSFDIDLAEYTVPNKSAIIQVKLEGTPAGGTLYFDNLYFWKAGTGGGSGSPVIFASNYSATATAWKTSENGDAGIYIDTSVPTQFWWNGIAPNDATPSFYFGYGTRITAKPWGFGAFVKAPNNGTTDVTGKSNLKIAVWGNDELVNTHPTLTLILKGPTVSACTSELKSSVTVPANGVQSYTVPLSGFTLQTACGYASTAAALAAGVNEVHIQVLGNNVQYVTGGNVDGDYPNGLNVGPISFE